MKSDIYGRIRYQVNERVNDSVHFMILSFIMGKERGQVSYNAYSRIGYQVFHQVNDQIKTQVMHNLKLSTE